MTTHTPLEIKVVYSASHRKRPGVTVVTTRARRSTPWILLGIMNIAAAGGMFYGIWWRVDSFLYLTFFWKTPIPGVDLDRVATDMFGLPPEEAAALPTERPEDSTGTSSTGQVPGETPWFTGEKAGAVLWATGYSWLALSTLACCTLALAGGSALGRVSGQTVRLLVAILAMAGLLALMWGAYQVWAEYGMAFEKTPKRVGLAASALLVVMFGLAIGRGARGLTRVAAVLLIVSAVGSVTGLYLGAQCGAISAEQSTPLFLAIVFVVHSFYGWMLLPIASRIGR